MIDEIIEKISADSGLSKEEIMDKLIDKQAEMSGLISEEGAAYMVAKDLGVSLLKQTRLNIENLVSGLQNIEIVAKITRISKKEFATEKATGTVANVYIADSTGSIRLTLWNDEIAKLNAKEGDVVKVRGYVKENGLNLELRLGKFGLIQKVDEEVQISPFSRSYERKDLIDLHDNSAASVRASVLQIFESNPFYEVCPQCESRIKEDEKGEFICAQHGVVEPNFNLVISGVIDDGTENMRAVFFGENAEKIINMTKEEARKQFMRKMEKSAIFSKVELGKEYVFEGVVRRSKLFERLEFIVNSINEIDIKKEIEMLI